MQDFQRLHVWQKAHALEVELRTVTRSFPRAERYGLTSQVRRAAESVAANIVEGVARNTDPETARFLRIAYASAAELQHHLLLARDLGFLAGPVHQAIEAKIVAIRKMLYRFIESVAPKR